MILKFSVNYQTAFGQTMFISGSIPELGSGEVTKAEPMTYTGDGMWEKELKIVTGQERLIVYRYIIKNNYGETIHEVGEPRQLAANKVSKVIILNDEWQGNTPTAPFISAPFSGIFFRHGNSASTRTHQYSKEIIIRATAPLTEKDAIILISGNCPALGNWNPSKAVRMSPTSGSKWEINLPAEKLPESIEYKFIKRNGKGKIIWESCQNRTLDIPPVKLHETFSIEHSATAFPLSNPRFAGTAVPVFSLRSENDCGAGDFSDIKLLADWAAVTGQRVIQLLPVNDTTSTGTWTDSYPYGGISVMALHPLYLNLNEAGILKDKSKKEAFEKERTALNELEKIDYERVMRCKMDYAKALFKEREEEVFAEPEFYPFMKKNKEWLTPYSAFCVLRDKNGTADFSKWGKYATYDNSEVEKMERSREFKEKMRFYVFLQYLLHKQLSDARNYAHSKGIAIKGDIPIGITPRSVEAWKEPYYFNMDSQAGAPPDAFSANGQNWGFPTYNWEKMASDGYIWWKKRFSKMSEYFDAYRIDHVLGFFRIWEIPAGQIYGLMGHFNPALPYRYEDLLNFGYNFNYERDAKPFIRYYQLKEMFGEKCEYVQKTFLDTNELDIYTLKPEFDTQKKISQWFSETGNKETNIMEGLMALVSEVLFLEDPRYMGCFHPRISAQYTYSYNALTQEQKKAYNALYDEFFYKRNNDFWKSHALAKLPELISATNMLTCAEDLGMIPSCVPEVLSMLRILTLEIQRMPKDPKQTFGNPAWYPYLCVCTTGTHDTSTLRGWWEEDSKISEKYFREMLGFTDEVPHSCEPWIVEAIVTQHLNSPAMLTVLPVQDWFDTVAILRNGTPEDERINIPSNPKHYWRYRIKITLEELLKKDSFNSHIASLIKESGRNN